MPQEPHLNQGPNVGSLPVHFFTIVLNGMPFIRYHLEAFRRLSFPWHWHIIEGVAELKHCTAWSVQNGGRLSDEFFENGISVDGTAEYLDEISQLYPQQISVYRKPGGRPWDGKLEMINVPITQIKTSSLLWEIDADELWSTENLERLYHLFQKYPEKTAAFVYCDYFVGPRKYVSSMNTWATYPNDWLRIWRFQPDCAWKSHEPPVLMNAQGRNLAECNPFSRDETLAQGIRFQHFAYTTEAQVRFKEVYYGYRDAVAHWKRLQASSGAVDPADYLPWAQRGARVEDWDVWMDPLLSSRIRTPAGEKKAEDKQMMVAGNYVLDHKCDSMAVQQESEFKICVRELFKQIRPQRIIETGTYLGMGTTAVVASTLRDLGIEKPTFFSIEVNPSHYQQALVNLANQGFSNVQVLLGLSVPNDSLPSLEEIERDTVKNVEFGNIFVDHQDTERARLYYQETHFDVADDLLGKALAACDYRPDFLLLDSAGYMGYLEFRYVIDKLKAPCYLMLDDVFHIKHYRSYLQMLGDPRFEVTKISHEKFGFCIARFTPDSAVISIQPVEEGVRSLLWLQLGSLSEAVVSNSTMPFLKQKYPNASIAVLCSPEAAELYEACPYVNSVISFDSRKGVSLQEDGLRRLQAAKADLLINGSLKHFDTASEIAALSMAREKITLSAGNALETSANQSAFNRIIPCKSESGNVLEQYALFLQAIGVQNGSVNSMVWRAPEDEEFGECFFREHGLDPLRTVVLAPGAQVPLKFYDRLNECLAPVSDFSVVLLGAASDAPANLMIEKTLPQHVINLSGQTTLRQCAALIRRSRIVIGAESCLLQIAGAVGTSAVTILGGGEFGRFFPIADGAHAVALPLDCYGCGWKCKYSVPHCIRDLDVGSVEQAIRYALDNPKAEANIFIREQQSYAKHPGGPEWCWKEGSLLGGNIA